MLKQQSAERSEYKSGQTLLFIFDQQNPIDWSTASMSFKVEYGAGSANWDIGSAQNVINEFRIYKDGKILEQIRSYNTYALHRDRLFTPYQDLRTKGSLIGYNAGSYFLTNGGTTIQRSIISPFDSGDEFTIPMKVISNIFEQVWTGERVKIEIVLANAAEALRSSDNTLSSYTIREPKIFYGCAENELKMPFTKVKTLRFSLDATDTQITCDLDPASKLNVERCMLVSRDEAFLNDVTTSSLKSEFFSYKRIRVRNDFVEYFNQPIKTVNELYHYGLNGHESSVDVEQFEKNLSAIIWSGRQYNSFVELEYINTKNRFIEVFVEHTSL